MSLPNIPDVNPYINISFEDAVNLLLTSVAMEEKSLSKLIDAEREKIFCAINDCKHKESMLHDTLSLNKSVDDTIKNITKLQMLLQFKIEDIKELLPKTKISDDTCVHTTFNTSKPPNTEKECTCCLSGIGKGLISNCCDEFYGCMAEICTCLCSDAKRSGLAYSVRSVKHEFCMTSSGCDINIKCDCDKIIVCGKGLVSKRVQIKSKCCNPCFSGMVNFILVVCRKIDGLLEFRMEFESVENPRVNHDSGPVQVRCEISDLGLYTRR